MSDPTAPRIICLSAAMFIVGRTPLEHVNISNLIDVDLGDFFASPNFDSVRTLCLSRLEIDNDGVAALSASERLKNLEWLDLSANRGIDRSGVEFIAAAVAAGRLPKLAHLELLGTECDATPYVDGYHWRMTNQAHDIAETHGFQAWMMLGSRKPEDECCELLTDAQIDAAGRRYATRP